LLSDKRLSTLALYRDPSGIRDLGRPANLMLPPPVKSGVEANTFDRSEAAE
jgi:hypothetical protein